ncbi:MAG: spinster family MFS transporter [Phycisphaerales bacterium]
MTRAPPATAVSTAAPGARQALALLLLLNLFNYLDRYILAAVEPLIRADFFAPDDPTAKSKMGLLATAFLVSYMVAAPLFGWLADRWRRWLIVATGCLVWTLASGASGLATGFMVMLVMRMFVGIGEAAYGPTAPTLIADLFPVARRGWVLSWFYVAIPIGSALGFVVGGKVAAMASWHWAFFVVVPPGLLLAAWCLFQREPGRGASDGRVAPQRARLGDAAALFRTPSWVLNTLGMTAMTFAIGGVSFWMPTYIHEFRGQSDLATVNLVFGGITVVAGLAATLSGGWLSDRLRARYPGSYFLVSGLSMLAGFPMFVGVLYAPFPLAWGLIAGAIFCLFFSTGPTNTILANVVHPSQRATGFAVNIFLIHALGDAISPPVIGWATDATRSVAHPQGNMNTGFLLVSGAILLSGVLWLIGTRHLAADTARAPTRLGNSG